MFAISNSELEEKSTVGKTTKCPSCKKKHVVEYGTDTKTGAISKDLGFVRCGKKSYLVAVNGKAL